MPGTGQLNSTLSGGRFGQTKTMKFYNNAIVGVDGSRTDFRWELCDWSAPYVQQWITSSYIKAGSYNNLFNYGNLNNSATIVGIKVYYGSNGAPLGNDIVLRWSFENSNEVYPLRSMLFLTGTVTHPIPGIKISNPTQYDVKIDMLIATDDLFMQVNTSIELSTNIAYDDLYYKNIRTHNRTQLAISILNAGGNPNDISSTTDLTQVGFIFINNIDHLELSGRTLIIDDTSIGKIFLGFIDEYTAKQVSSEINYLKNNLNEHTVSYTLPLPFDTTGPVFTFDSTIINNTATMYLDGWNGTILPQNIIDSLIIQIYDDRDGYIIPNLGILEIYQNNSIITQITSIGTYQLRWAAYDIAGNQTVHMMTLNIILSNDTTGPTIIWSNAYQPENGQQLPYAIIYLDNYLI